MEFQLSTVIDILPLLLKGAQLTLLISVSAFALALIGGFIIWRLTVSAPKWVAICVTMIADFIRSTPLLVQVFFVYFVGPSYGLVLDPVWAGILTFGLHYSCYLSEVYRSAFLSVPNGQWEAAKSLGLSRGRILLLVVLPQMLPVFVPIAGSYLIYMFKDTPLLAAVTVREMMYSAQKYGAENFVYFEPFPLVGLIFLVMSICAAIGIRYLEAAVSGWKTAR